MKHIEVEFERGNSYEAKLFDEKAPRTCNIIKNNLPFTYEFHQSIVSGQAAVTLPPEDLEVPEENQRTIGIPTGSLCYLVKDPPRNVPEEIYITYGPYFTSSCSTIDFQQPVNVFGQLDGDEEELESEGNRILMEGAETVTFRLAED